MPNTIEVGPFAGWSYEQLYARRQKLIEQRGNVSALVGSNVNGNSYSFAQIQEQLRFLNEEANDIQAALYYLRPDLHPMRPPSNSSAVRFA